MLCYIMLSAPQLSKLIWQKLKKLW